MPLRIRWLLPLGTFAVFSGFGLSKFAHYWLDDLARGHTGTLPQRLIEELTGAYAAGVIFLLLVGVVYRWPLSGERWLRRLPGYLLLVVAAALAHTTMMWLSRRLIYPLVGLGAYDYGIMRYRYPMEFALQAPNILLLVGLIHGWRYYRRQRLRELETARLAGELSRVRLERLEAQLQPHFLFNTLNGVSALMYQDPARADRLLGRLSDLLRLTFERSSVAEVPLARELEWLGWYLDLMRLRIGDRLTVTIAVPAELGGLLVPRLILQPLVENAIKHGAARRAGPAVVQVVARRAGERLTLAVLDDGPGVAEPAGHGVGLSNTIERLRVLYGGAASLRVENRRDGGAAVTLELPARPAPMPEAAAAPAPEGTPLHV